MRAFLILCSSSSFPDRHVLPLLGQGVGDERKDILRVRRRLDGRCRTRSPGRRSSPADRTPGRQTRIGKGIVRSFFFLLYKDTSGLSCPQVIPLCFIRAASGGSRPRRSAPERRGDRVLILVIGHAEPFRVGVQHADAQHAFRSARRPCSAAGIPSLSSPVGSARRNAVKVFLQLCEDPRREAPEIHGHGVSGA